jgi:phage-related protein
MEYRVRFYARPSGASPVQEHLDAQNLRTRQALLRELALLGELGPRTCDTRHLRGKIWELRIRCEGKQHRVLYFIDRDRVIVLLLAFLKKTGKTPPRHIESAERYRSEYLSSG